MIPKTLSSILLKSGLAGILTWFFATTAFSQKDLGLTTGLLVNSNFSSLPVNLPSVDIALQANTRKGGNMFFGFYVENALSKQVGWQMEMSVYKNAIDYQYFVPAVNASGEDRQLLATSTTNLFVVGYRPMLKFYTGRHLWLSAGPSMDINFASRLEISDDLNQNYPKVAELIRLMDNSYNPLVLFADMEVGWRLKRLDISVNSRYSLTSATGRFIYYDNEVYQLNNKGWQIFVRLGWRIIRDATPANSQNCCCKSLY